MVFEMNVGGTLIPGWIVVLVIVVLIMFAFGWWKKVYEWGKAIWTKTTNKPVSESLDKQVVEWFTKWKSGKVVFMLNRCAEEFEGQGDKTSAKELREYIPKAAAWKEK